MLVLRIMVLDEYGSDDSEEKTEKKVSKKDEDEE